MIDMHQLLAQALDLGASDVHLTTGLPPMVRLNGELAPVKGYSKFLPEECTEIVLSLMTDARKARFLEIGEIDFSYVIPGIGRCRINAFKQRKTFSAAIRLFRQENPNFETLKLPPILMEYALKTRGLFLVTGPTGSGKSSTLAAMVEYINRSRKCHILTIEDPIEFLYRHDQSIVNQREVGDDSGTFVSALRSALREDPDVILLGEMRDLETMSTAIAAAETGHFVMSTLHTISASQTVERIINLFPPNQQSQIRTQLAAILQCVVAQQLIPDIVGKSRVPAFEILVVNDAIRNMIRDDKTHMIASAMQTGIKQGMLPMDYSIAQLLKANRISESEAYQRCHDPEMLTRYLSVG